MKTIAKPILALAALATSLGSTARADNVYIVGAQAARSAVNPIIRQIPGVTLVATTGATTGNADADGAYWNLWKTSSNTYIAAYWNGGEGAVRALLATNATFAKVPFISTNTAPGTANISSSSLLSDTNGVVADLIQPQIAIANNGAAYSRFNGTSVSQLLPGATVATTLKYNKTAQDVIVDISTYGFAADRSFTNTGVKSITAKQAKALFQYGNVPLSLFTGNTNDAQSTVWLIGRNIDSGARVTVFNEVGYGGLANTYNHIAYAYVTNGGLKTISAIGLTAPSVVDGIKQPIGNDGYGQGSDVIKNILPVVAGTDLGYVTPTNTIITAVTTNPVATNTVTNNTVGSNNVYGGTAFGYVPPATGVYYTVKTQGSTSKATVFNAISYYLTTNYYTNKVVNTTNSPAARSVYTTNTNVNLTNAWSKTGTNYLIAYESLANIGSSKNTNANGQLPILLSYNGVGAAGAIASSAVTAALGTNVANGSYTLWNYDHVLLNSNGLACAAVTGVRDSIINYLATNVAAPNLTLGARNITGGGDGGTAYPVGVTNQ
jgi:hypothetical protein